MYTHKPVAEPSTFYKSFSEKKLTSYGSSRRGRIEQHRLGLLHRYRPAPGEMVEVGPGHGTLAEQAVDGRRLLAAAVLWMGVYPKPFTDAMHVSVTELLRHVAVSKLN